MLAKKTAAFVNLHETMVGGIITSIKQTVLVTRGQVCLTVHDTKLSSLSIYCYTCAVTWVCCRVNKSSAKLGLTRYGMLTVSMRFRVS